MYRTAAKRLFCGARHCNNSNIALRFRRPQPLIASSSRFSTSENPPLSDPLPTTITTTPVYTTETLNVSDTTSSSSSSSSQSQSQSSSTAEDYRRHEIPKPGAKYQDEQARLLHASLFHVLKLGWTEASLIAGAKDVGLSPSIVGSLPRKEAALVEFFMDDCLQRLVDRIDTDESLKNLLTPSDYISKVIRYRLEMQAPYISTWPQALSIQAQPVNVPTSFKQRAMLVDEIWHAAGDNASDIDWYAKRTILGGIYSTTEIYMLTDTSPDFRDTWTFLDARVKDAFDLKKTLQEAQYLAEAVSAGLGNSFQGFFGQVLRR